jgi:hypothetical protein
MRIFIFLIGVLNKIQKNLSEAIPHSGAKYKIYLQEQTNIAEYPCIILKMQQLKPCPTTIPSYEFYFSINAISDNQMSAIALPRQILASLNTKTMQMHDESLIQIEEKVLNTTHRYKINHLAHIGTSWDTAAEDRFSVRTQMKYQGSVVLERV